jgi:hypothetical protein
MHGDALIIRENIFPYSKVLERADSDDLARVYRYDLAQDSEMISPTIPI